MIVVIDNYDSFTYNLVQYLEELGAKTIVFRNDRVTVNQVKRLKPRYLLISPGPGDPQDSGVSLKMISEFYKKIPILGVCLGHQCIGYVFGAKIKRAAQIMHGKTSLVYHDKSGIFQGIKNPFIATRYHSLIIDPKTLPANLRVNAKTKDNTIMAISDKREPLYGVQFHPESILTETGKLILANFLNK